MKKVRVWPKPWPKWYGSFINWRGSTGRSGWHLYVGECSHKTSWQIRIDTPNYSWYWVLRLWDYKEQ